MLTDSEGVGGDAVEGKGNGDKTDKWKEQAMRERERVNREKRQEGLLLLIERSISQAISALNSLPIVSSFLGLSATACSSEKTHITDRFE